MGLERDVYYVGWKNDLYAMGLPLGGSVVGTQNTIQVVLITATARCSL
jgi:hypothetical protein